MRRALTTAALTALLASLLALPAQGATRFETFRAQMLLGPAQQDGGAVELRVKFRNTAGDKKRFTPRRITRVGFESVPLTCTNEPGDPSTSLQLTTSVQAEIGVSPAGPPNAAKPKKGRYAFVFGGVPDLPSTTISGKIDKPNKRKRGTPPRAHGRFTIGDLDSGPGYTNCATNGSRDWSAPRPVGK